MKIGGLHIIKYSEISTLLPTKLRQPLRLELCIDLRDMVHELALQIVPHLWLVFCRRK